MITMEGKYQTRDGRAVRILCVDGQDTSFPVVGFIEDHLCTHNWAADGHWLPPVGVGWGNSVDLVPVPTKHEGWVPLLTAGNSDVPRIDGIVKVDKEETRSFCERYHAYALAHVTWED